MLSSQFFLGPPYLYHLGWRVTAEASSGLNAQFLSVSVELPADSLVRNSYLRHRNTCLSHLGRFDPRTKTKVAEACVTVPEIRIPHQLL